MADQENTEVWDMDSNKYVLSLSLVHLSLIISHSCSLPYRILQLTVLCKITYFLKQPKIITSRRWLLDWLLIRWTSIFMELEYPLSHIHVHIQCTYSVSLSLSLSLHAYLLVRELCVVSVSHCTYTVEVPLRICKLQCSVFIISIFLQNVGEVFIPDPEKT